MRAIVMATRVGGIEEGNKNIGKSDGNSDKDGK
jgi:hypothetical protein